MTDENKQGLDPARIANRDYYRQQVGRRPFQVGDKQEPTGTGHSGKPLRFSEEPLETSPDLDSAA